MSAESSALLDPELLIGRVLAERYLIEERLGEGGMGMVYRASHVKVGRSFAIKVLHPELLRNEKVVWRFEREAESAARMRHPNVVPALDVGTTEEGLRYLVMDFVDGPDLASLMQEAPMPPPRVIWLVRQICEGLQHAHHHGLVHRDLKPQNIIVECDAEGREIPRIVDFGISILATEEGEDESSRLTTNGMVLGTPLYMAPEQAVAGDIDHRVDLFALGLICYEMLSGAMPFDGTGAQVARANLMLDAPPMSRRVPDLSVDPLLEAFTRKLMQRDRDRRPASARDARELLDLIERDRKAAAIALGVANDVAPSQVMTVPRLPSVAPPPSPRAPSQAERRVMGSAATEVSSRFVAAGAASPAPLVMVQEEGSEVVVSLSPLSESGPAPRRAASAGEHSRRAASAGEHSRRAASAAEHGRRAHSVSDVSSQESQAYGPQDDEGDDYRGGPNSQGAQPYFPGDPPPLVAQPWQGRAPESDRRAERYMTTDHHGYRQFAGRRRRWWIVGLVAMAFSGAAIAIIVMVGGEPQRGEPTPVAIGQPPPDAGVAVADLSDVTQPVPVIDPPPQDAGAAQPPADAAVAVTPTPPITGGKVPSKGGRQNTSGGGKPVTRPGNDDIGLVGKPVPAEVKPKPPEVKPKPPEVKPVPPEVKPAVTEAPVVSTFTGKYRAVGQLLSKLTATNDAAAEPLWVRYRLIQKDKALGDPELRRKSMEQLLQIEKSANSLMPRL